jgi:hypothetical protein
VCLSKVHSFKIQKTAAFQSTTLGSIIVASIVVTTFTTPRINLIIVILVEHASFLPLILGIGACASGN